MRTKARHYYPPIKKCRGSTLNQVKCFFVFLFRKEKRFREVHLSCKMPSFLLHSFFAPFFPSFLPLFSFFPSPLLPFSFSPFHFGETQTQPSAGVRGDCLRELLDSRCTKRRALQWRSQKCLRARAWNSSSPLCLVFVTASCFGSENGVFYHFSKPMASL